MGSTGEPPPPSRGKLPTLQDLEVSTSGAPRATSQHPPDRGALVQTSGLEAGRLVALSFEPLTIGTSADCGAQVADEDAAPLQARIAAEGAHWVVEDVGGGTFVDDAPATHVTLVPGAHVRFASVSFRYQLVDRTEEAALDALYSTSVRDGLTGLFNRAHLVSSLVADLAYAKRRGETLAIAVLDIDGMRAVNARHGHAIGDEVVKRVSDRARMLARDAPLFRSAGDELTLIVRREGEAEARDIAVQIRAAVDASPITIGEISVALTVRFATAGAVEGEDATALFARARRLVGRSG